MVGGDPKLLFGLAQGSLPGLLVGFEATAGERDLAGVVAKARWATSEEGVEVPLVVSKEGDEDARPAKPWEPNLAGGSQREGRAQLLPAW